MRVFFIPMGHVSNHAQIWAFVTSISHMGQMRDSDWSREILLRSDWLQPKVAPITTRMALRDSRKTIDLFFYASPTSGEYHYSLIKNFSRLFRSQITSTTNKPIHICKRCLTHFTNEDLFLKHPAYCSSNETVAVKMPPRKTILKFENYHKKFPIPFVIYADFECFTKPMGTCCPNPENSYSYNYQKHEPSGFCFYMKGVVPGIKFKPILYTKKTPNDDVANFF